MQKIFRQNLHFSNENTLNFSAQIGNFQKHNHFCGVFLNLACIQKTRVFKHFVRKTKE